MTPAASKILETIKLLEDARAKGEGALQEVVADLTSMRMSRHPQCVPFCIMVKIMTNDMRARIEVGRLLERACEQFCMVRGDTRRIPYYPVIEPGVDKSGRWMYMEYTNPEKHTLKQQIEKLWVRGPYAEDRWMFIAFVKDFILNMEEGNK